MTTPEARLHVKITPGAAENAVLGWQDSVLRLRIAARPKKGQANRALIDFLSQRLGLGRDSIIIKSGHTSRDKLIAVCGLSRAELLSRLTAPPPQQT